MANIDFMTEATAQDILGNLRLANAYTKIYLEGLEIDSWAALVEIAKSGKANTIMSVGDTITAVYTVGANEYTNTWLVLGFRDVELENGDEYENVPIIGMQYTTHENVVFDPAETTEATEETAQAGFYYCGWDGSSTYTMLNLSTGDEIPYSSYTKVYKTLWNSANPIRYGLNNWKFSFARQYLNNSGTGWATPQHACDVLPNNAASMTGFKSFMPADMISALHPIKIQTKQPTYMGSGLDTTYDMFWLLSVSEMNMENGNASPDDGEPLEYFKELSQSESKVNTGTYSWMIRYAVNATTSAQAWWARSAGLGNMNEWVVNSYGVVYNYIPSSGYRLLPACALI